MSFEFRPARLESTNVLLAFAGPSGCGKTYTALRVARGLVGPEGKIAFIDTEARRALHYAKKFSFDHLEMRAPFRPERIQEAIKAAEGAGYSVAVIDSMSHEHDGVGGLVEWADEIERGGVKSPGNWREPKMAHRRLMNTLLQSKMHLIFCLRADEKIKIERVNGKTVVIPMGWQPICEKRFMYEMTCSFLMGADAPGIPRPIKLQDQHAEGFPLDKQIGERAGEFLAQWANSGIPVVVPPTANENTPKPTNDNAPVVVDTKPARKLGLIIVDGSTVDYPTADKYLTALASLMVGKTSAQVQALWDMNQDLFYKIMNAAKSRNDALITARCEVIGRSIIEKLSPEGM